MKVYRAWYVAEADLLTTAHVESPERFPIREGETLTLPASVIPRVCEAGYHASPKLLDALEYRTEGLITLVEVSGDVSVGSDKIAGRSRKTLRIVPQAIADRECRLFAADVAERALQAEREAGREPAEESFAAVEIARRFALGDASREELTEAKAAAGVAEAEAWATMRVGAAAAKASAKAAEAAAWAAVTAAEAARAAAEAAWATATADAARAVVMTSRSAARAELSTELEARILKAIGEQS